MKRTFLLAFFLAAAGLAVSASYSIHLKDGKVIKADEKPVVNAGFAYFQKNGLYLYLPADRIDFEKSERVNAVAQAPVKGFLLEGLEETATPAPKAPKVFIDQQQLELIRQRARLANEGELLPPPQGAEEPATAPSSPGLPSAPAPDVSGMRSQLSGLIEQRTLLYQQQNDLQGQLSTLRDRYNFSVQQSEQEAYQKAIDATQNRLNDVQRQISDLGGQIDSLQQQINATPVVVQERAAPSGEGPGT
ncbi:MAG: hypothetical protein ACP5VN_07300 [Acidobacteriota bacterium]